MRIKLRKIKKLKPLDPWEKFPPGSSKKNIISDGYDPKLYNARRDAHAFIWMVFWGCIDDKFGIDETINKWWDYTFIKPFPEEGGTAEDLVDRIYSRLIEKGFNEQNIEPDEDEYNPPILRSNCMNWNKHKDMHIPKLREVEMKVKLKKKTASKTGGKKSAGKKVSQKKAPSEKNGRIPKWVGQSREGTKAHDSKLLCCKLLLERKYSLSEICLMVESELEYNVSEARVDYYRKCLNRGYLEPLGFSMPSKPVEVLDKPAGKKSVKKSSKKKVVKKTTKKKATTTKKKSRKKK